MVPSLRDRLDERINPILVKEMYQAIRSRVFMTAFWLLLLISFTIYCLVYHNVEYSTGKYMLSWFTPFLVIMVVFFIPSTAFFGLYREVTNKTLELVQVTRMSPHRLVRGLLCAAAVKVVLFYAILAPFVVTSFLFGGVDLVMVLTISFGAFMISLCACALSLSFAAQAVYPRMRNAVRWMYSLGLIAAVLSLYGMTGVFFYGPSFFFSSSSGFDMGLFIAILLCWTALFIVFIIFLSSVAANSLTFPHNRSSARSKVLSLVLVPVFFLALLLTEILNGSRDFDGLIAPFQALSCTFIGLASLLWITAGEHVPWRHQVRFNKKRGIGLFYWTFFRDGPLATMCYLFLIAAVIGVCVLILGQAELLKGGSISSREFKSALYPIPFTVTYVLYLSMFAHIINRLLPARLRSDYMKRCALLFAVLVMGLLAVLVYSATDLDTFPGTLSALVPFLYLITLDSDPSGIFVAIDLAPIFFIGFLYHVSRYAPRTRKKALEREGAS